MKSIEQRIHAHWPISILSLVTSIFATLLPLVIVRMLSAEDVGIFKVFFLYLTIFPALSLTAGVRSGLPFWVGQQEQRESAFQASALSVFVAGLLLACICLALHTVGAGILGWTDLQAVLFCIALGVGVAATYFDEASIAVGHIWRGALFYSGFELLRICTILAAVAMYRTITAIFIAHTAVVALKAVAGFYYGYRLNIVGLNFDRTILRGVWRYAFPVSIAWVFGIVFNYADQIVLSTFLSSTEFAFYSIGCLTLPPIFILEQSITRVLIPEMSCAFARNDARTAGKLFRQAASQMAQFFIPAVIGLVVFARPIIEILFTKQYSSAFQYLQWYALSYLLFIVPFDAVARAKGHAHWILKAFLLFSVLSLSCAYLFTRLYGPYGALATLLLSGIAMRLYTVQYMKRECGWRTGDFFPIAAIIRISIVSLLAGVVADSLRPLFGDEHLWFFVCGPLFAGATLLLSFVSLRSPNVQQISDSPSVLMVTQGLTLGGLERMVLNLCAALKAKGIEDLSVFAYDHESVDGSATLLPEFERKGIRVEAFKKPGGFSLQVVRRLVRKINRGKIEIIHTHDLGGLMYAVIARCFCLRPPRLMHTQHSFIHLDKAKRYQLYERFFTRFADQVTVVSPDTKNVYVRMGFPEQKIHLIPNGVDFLSSHLVDRLGRHTLRRVLCEELQLYKRHDVSEVVGGYWIVYLARLYPRKGQDHALHLWKKLDPAIRRATTLFLVGPEAIEGERQRLEDLIAASPDAERVVLVGGSAHPQRWLAAADVYLSCSEYEGMPLGPLEAVGSGVPAVLSAIPGHRFLEHLSVQYSLDEPAQGARQLASLLKELRGADERYYLRLWESSRILREKFSLSEMALRYMNLYTEPAL